MPSSCVISSFNYRQYVSEAVDSALNQTLPFDEIVVVDDASGDGSAEYLRSTYGGDDRVRLIESPENRGQLAALMTGVDATRGDILFFLDSDDVYTPGYHERIMKAYSASPRADFVFCAYTRFGVVSKVKRVWPRDRDHGYSVLRTYYRRPGLGGPTSTLSLRRWVFDALRPSFHPEGWRAYPDDCLIRGAGLIGAYKRYVAEPLVQFRVHGKNYSYPKPTHDAVLEKYNRRLEESRFIRRIKRRMEFDVPHLLAHVHREFESIPRPDLRDVYDYLAMTLLRTSVRRSRLHSVWVIAKHYLATRSAQEN